MTGEAVPRPAPPPERTEPAHTCAGWILVARGERPRCSRCEERLAAYTARAAGHGTVSEIREAISALETISTQGTPMGECVRTKIRGLTVWACPRSVNVSGDDGDPRPLIEVAGNRRARRRSLKSKRGRGER